MTAGSDDNNNAVCGLALLPGVSLGTSDTVTFLPRAAARPHLRGQVLPQPALPDAHFAMVCDQNDSCAQEKIRETHAAGSWDAFEAALRQALCDADGSVMLVFHCSAPEIVPHGLCGNYALRVTTGGEVRVLDALPSGAAYVRCWRAPSACARTRRRWGWRSRSACM